MPIACFTHRRSYQIGRMAYGMLVLLTINDLDDKIMNKLN